jgi:hypothetical protein
VALLPFIAGSQEKGVVLYSDEYYGNRDTLKQFAYYADTTKSPFKIFGYLTYMTAGRIAKVEIVEEGEGVFAQLEDFQIIPSDDEQLVNMLNLTDSSIITRIGFIPFKSNTWFVKTGKWTFYRDYGAFTSKYCSDFPITIVVDNYYRMEYIDDRNGGNKTIFTFLRHDSGIEDMNEE